MSDRRGKPPKCASNKTRRMWLSGEEGSADEVRVMDYDVAVVKSWLRAAVSVAPRPSDDPAQRAFDEAIVGYLCAALGDTDEHIAMGISVGRRIELESGTAPEMLQVIREAAPQGDTGKDER